MKDSRDPLKSSPACEIHNSELPKFLLCNQNHVRFLFANEVI